MHRLGRRRGVGRWLWPVGGLAVWLLANVVWLTAERGSRLLELDEAGYTAVAMRFGRHTQPDSMWRTIQQGNHGPMQSLLAAPVQWITGPDAGVLLWQSLLLVAATGVLAGWMAGRLAGRGAGLVAGAVVLLSAGLLDHSRSALTVAPATAFAAAAVACLLAGGGLRRPGWAALAGAAAGAMVLSRTMAVAYLPALAVAALGWSWAARTGWRRVAVGAATAAAAALAIAGWWWLAVGDRVVDYLRSGSADAARSDGLGAVLDLRLTALVDDVGGRLLVVAAVAAVGLGLWDRWRGGDRGLRDDEREDGPATARAADLPVWPLLAAAAVGVGATLLSSVVPRGAVVPVVPWLVVAVVVTVRRRLSHGAWRAWSAVVVGAALLLALVVGARGIGGNEVWCGGGSDERLTCDVTAPSDQRAWRTSIDELTVATNRAWQAHLVREPGTYVDVAVASRDWLVSSNALALSAEDRLRWSFDQNAFFAAEATHAEQVDDVARRADLVVVVPDADRPTGALALSPWMADPADVADDLLGRGYEVCAGVVLPDGREAEVLVRTPAPPGGCG